MQNRFSWHQQLQKIYLTWCKPSVRIKALDLTAYLRQSWRKLRMRFLFLSRQSLTIPLKTGSFPTYWNLHKWFQYLSRNGSRLSCNNYTPISLLSNIGKIIEKLIHNRLNHFLEQHKDLPISTWTRDLPISTKVWRNLAKFQPKTEVYISTHPESHCLKFGYEGVCNKRSFKYKETVASTYLS